eukprot:gene9739-6827_t
MGRRACCFSKSPLSALNVYLLKHSYDVLHSPSSSLHTGVNNEHVMDSYTFRFIGFKVRTHLSVCHASESIVTIFTPVESPSPPKKNMYNKINKCSCSGFLFMPVLCYKTTLGPFLSFLFPYALSHSSTILYAPLKPTVAPLRRRTSVPLEVKVQLDLNATQYTHDVEYPAYHLL